MIPVCHYQIWKHTQAFKGDCPLPLSSHAALYAASIAWIRLIPSQKTVSCQLLYIPLWMFKETAFNSWEKANQAFTVQAMPASSLLIRLTGTSYSSESMRRRTCPSCGFWPIALKTHIYCSLQGFTITIVVLKNWVDLFTTILYYGDAVPHHYFTVIDFYLLLAQKQGRLGEFVCSGNPWISHLLWNELNRDEKDVIPRLAGPSLEVFHCLFK